MPDDPYTLADLARLAGVTPRTVRYYVVQGLLPSPEQAGPATRYTEGHLARLRLIRRLQREHLPLAEIRARLEGLDEQQILDAVGADDDEAPQGDALGFVHALMSQSGVEPSLAPPAAPQAARAAAEPPASPAPPLPLPAAAPMPHRTAETRPPLLKRVELPPPAPRTVTPDRSTWERLVITPDVELHVRRPLDRQTNRRVDQLERIARELLQDDR
jgi:DNA-binding transcriptional MerR regulator